MVNLDPREEFAELQAGCSERWTTGGVESNRVAVEPERMPLGGEESIEQSAASHGLTLELRGEAQSQLWLVNWRQPSVKSTSGSTVTSCQ